MFFICGCITPRFGPVNVKLNRNVDQNKYKLVAVAPYDVSGYNGQGRDFVSGQALADRYTHELMGAGYNVIERSQLEAIMREQQISNSDLVNPRYRSKVGKLLGIQGIVFGSVSGRPNAFSVMSRLVDVETGITVWSIVISNNIERNAIKKLKQELRAYRRGRRIEN